MGVISSSKISVHIRTTLNYIPEDGGDKFLQNIGSHTDYTEVISSSKISVHTRTTLNYIPEDGNIQSMQTYFMSSLAFMHAAIF
jgi:hypothetical protein